MNKIAMSSRFIQENLTSQSTRLAPINAVQLLLGLHHKWKENPCSPPAWGRTTFQGSGMMLCFWALLRAFRADTMACADPRRIPLKIPSSELLVLKKAPQASFPFQCNPTSDTTKLPFS